MKTFQIVIVDETGSTTFKLQAYTMYDALHSVQGIHHVNHENSVASITCTTL